MKLKASNPSNNDDVPHSLPMPREDCNGLTVESAPNNDDSKLSHQQFNNINTPSFLQTTHKDCK